MSTVDAYGPSSQTLTFLDTEDGDLTVGGDTQVSIFDNDIHIFQRFLINSPFFRLVTMNSLISPCHLKLKHRRKLKANWTFLRIVKYEVWIFQLYIGIVL